MHVIKATYVMLSMLLLMAAAFGMGPLFFRNQISADVPKEVVPRLRWDLVSGFKIRPFTLQLIEARVYYFEPPYEYEERGVVRTLFGIPVGELSLGDGEWSNGFDIQRWWQVWLAFFAVEVTMGAYCVWWIRTYWW